MANLMYMLGAPSWVPQSVREVLEPTLMILMAVLAVAAIVVIMMQKGTSNNVGAISGETETFMGKNKGRTMESKLKKITIGIGVALLVVSVLFFVLASN